MFSDVALEANGGKHCLKLCFETTRKKRFFDLFDIWRIRNPTRKPYTFRQKHISNSVQDYTKDAGIPMFLLTDHSPVFLLFFNGKSEIYGHGFWKFNSSLICDTGYVLRTKNLIKRF